MSLRLKTILGVGLIEAILLLILISTVLSYMRSTSNNNLNNFITTTTTLSATATQDAILSHDLATLDTFIEEILKNKAVIYASIKDIEETVLAEGGQTELLRADIPSDTDLDKVHDGIYDTRKDIIIEGTIYGHIDIGFSTKEATSALSDAKRMAAIIAAIEMLLVGLFSFILGVYLTKQLKILRISAKRVAEGDLDTEIKITSRDEIADVASAFNKMTTKLKKSQQETEKYHQELIDLNQQLEDRVERRTHQLSEKNQQLEETCEKLKQAQEQLIHSEKLASIGQLAAGVAHEINNPVSFIKSNLHSLKNYIKTYQSFLQHNKNIINYIDTTSEAESDTFKQLKQTLEEFDHTEDMDFIHSDIGTLVDESIVGTDRVSEIVKGLKVYSRSGEDSMTECDINQCINDTLRMLNNEIKYKCEVVTHLGDIPPLKADEGKLSQVFTNLTINAVQAIHDTGTITIRTFVEHEAIVVTIADNGKGIKPEILSQLFDPFFTTKPVGEGTGLGLSISDGIINDHGGSIHVASELDIGTEFRITLPLKPVTHH